MCIRDSFCIVKDGQMHVHGMHISPYEKGNIFNKDPLRSRRLLMHKREIPVSYTHLDCHGGAPCQALERPWR